MPFDYEGAKAAGYSDAEINQFISQSNPAPRAATNKPTVMQNPPTNIPYDENPAARQKFQETYNAKAGENAAAQEFKTSAKDQILAALDPVERGVEEMKLEGGYNPLYTNESLVFGKLPGVQPLIGFAQSQGLGQGDSAFTGKDSYLGSIANAKDNRVAQEANIAALRAMLKNAIRSPGEGNFTDADQALLNLLLPSGQSYESDKKIIKALREGVLLNDIEKYRASDAWKAGLPKQEGVQPMTAAQPQRMAQPVNLYGEGQPQQLPPQLPATPQAPRVVDYTEFFR